MASGAYRVGRQLQRRVRPNLFPWLSTQHTLSLNRFHGIHAESSQGWRIVLYTQHAHRLSEVFRMSSPENPYR